MKVLAVIFIAALAVCGCSANRHRIGVNDLKQLLQCRDRNLHPQEDFHVEQVTEMWLHGAIRNQFYG